MTSYSIDEYESVGERGAYRNAILANEARRARVSSPADSRTVVKETAVTPPPVMIPSTDMIREMAEDRFLDFVGQTTTTVIQDIEEPIDYHREAEQPHDDDLGLPFFPNHPSSLRYYPLLIRTDDFTTQKVAAYIYYCNRDQEVVGTMGCDQPLYATPVYLSTPNLTHLPIPMTNSQILQFSAENPHAYAIDKTL